MKRNQLIVTALALTCSATAYGAQAWSVTVSDSTTAQLECPDAGDADTCLLAAGKTNAFENGATVTIRCADAAVCQDVTLQRENRGAPVSQVKGASAPSATSKLYTLSSSDLTAATSVGVFHKRNLLVPFTLQPTAPARVRADDGGGGGDEPPAPAGTLEQTIAASTPIQLSSCPHEVTGTYSARHDDGDAAATAVMYVDALGNVLAKPSESFDENDRLTVYVLGDEELLKRLKVARTSDIRDLTTVHIIGQEQAAPSIERHARGECMMRKFDPIDSFAPGKGVVTISRVRGDAVESIGNFELNVATLYSGIFSLGAARTEAVDPKFKLVTNGTDQVIAPGDSSDKDTVYTIFYTPFVWGKRDLEKPFDLSQWYRHINPTVGFAVDDVSNNFLGGLSIDLPRGIVITAGWHYRKITQLSKQSGLAVGSVFTGEPDTLPTAKSWESEQFIAVSVDIRVMGQLIRNAFTGGAK